MSSRCHHQRTCADTVGINEQCRANSNNELACTQWRGSIQVYCLTRAAMFRAYQRSAAQFRPWSPARDIFIDHRLGTVCIRCTSVETANLLDICHQADIVTVACNQRLSRHTLEAILSFNPKSSSNQLQGVERGLYSHASAVLSAQDIWPQICFFYTL